MKEENDHYALLEEIPQISEGVFVNKFLPMLLREMTAEDVSVWVDVTKSMFLPMNVVDANKETLFRVPPLRYPSKTQVGGDVESVINEYMLIQDYHEKSAGIFLNNNTDKLFTPSEPPENDVDQWRLIFKRYNLHKGVKVKTDANVDEGLSDDEYEEW